MGHHDHRDPDHLGDLRWLPKLLSPDFARGFLQGRSEYFYSLYQYAFYTHIVVAPAVLILGLPQFSQRLRTKYVRLHLRVGSVYTYLVLGLVVPSGLVMSFYAMGGVASVLAFFAQSLLTFATTTIGWQRIRQGRIREHGVWMIRSYLLISAAVNLRLLAIVSDQLDLAPTVAYTCAAWLSWLVPLVIFEIWIRYGRRML